MRKHIKERIIALAVTVEEAGRFVLECLERSEETQASSVMEDERQCALSMAEIIGQSEGKEHPLVKQLQEYGVLIRQCSGEIDDKKRMNLAKILFEEWKKIKEALEKKIPVRYEAVFLPYKASMWDSLESVWLAGREDKDWDCYVVPIPYYDKNQDNSFGSLHYEGDLYPEYVPVTPFNEYNLEARHPDVIFIHNPYDECNHVTSVHPAFYSSIIKKYTDLLVYIPYYICMGDVPDWHCLTPGVIHSGLVIVQSEEVRQTYIRVLSKELGWDEKTARQAGLYDKFQALGSPKIDKVLNTRQEDIVLPDEWRKKIYG